MTRRSWAAAVPLALVLVPVLVLGSVTGAGAVEPGPPVNQTSPGVTGTLRVGELLTATTGEWTPEPASYQYSWLRDDIAVSGEHAKTYRLTGADLGHRIAVQVIGVGSDTTPGTPVISADSAEVGLGRFSLTGVSRILGTRRWGHELKVVNGTWSPKPTKVVYQWLANGNAIKGATRARYTPTPADFGKKLTVRVSARRAYYANLVSYSLTTGPIGHRVRVKKHFTYSIATRGNVTANMRTFAAIAARVYADPQGWRSAGYEFTPVAHGGDFTLVLSSASRMASFGYPCDSTWSCRVGRNVIINQTRWLHASPAWNAAHRPLLEYRNMVINHETGHWLGHHHLTCPGKGRLAPLMMQQSKGLHGCRFNPFPLPSERWTSR
ncbi:MAG: DUF3152 domain-containing protein [Marmoricola sp.]